MEMVLAFLGFLACLIALGYGLYHLVKYVLKKEKRFSKRLFWPLFIGGLVLLFTGAALAEPDTSAANAEKKYSALNAEYKNLTKEHEELEKEYKSVSSEAKKLKDNKEDQDKLEKLKKCVFDEAADQEAGEYAAIHMTAGISVLFLPFYQ